MSCQRQWQVQTLGEGLSMHRYGLRVPAILRGQLQQSIKRPDACFSKLPPSKFHAFAWSQLRFHLTDCLPITSDLSCGQAGDHPFPHKASRKPEQFHLADTKPFTDRVIAVFVLPAFLRDVLRGRPLNCFSVLHLGSPTIDRLPY